MRGSSWHKVPMLRVLLPFITGILCGMYFEVPYTILIISITLCTFLLGILHAFTLSYHFRWLPGICINLLFIGIGILQIMISDERFPENHFSKLQETKYLSVMLTDDGSGRKEFPRFRGSVEALINDKGQQFGSCGNVMIFLKGENQSLHYGDILIIPHRFLKEIPSPQNPGEFDYRNYLSQNGIHFGIYPGRAHLQPTGLNRGSKLMIWVFRLQHTFREILHNSISSPAEIAVALALLYGYDDDISAETMDAYAKTGTLHVLAVSGMHVGLIFIVLGWILFPLEKNRHTRVLKNIIVLITLWFYSFLCGLSPSILRATLMFSVVLFGAFIQRKGNTFNTLAASAFVLLAASPLALSSAGFQLSYLAVTGILLFYERIKRVLSPSLWLLRQIWNVCAISLAAQLTTFPLGLYYFHFFPNFFLLSNLLIIPLTTLVIYAEIILMAIYKISFISFWLGKIIFWFIYLSDTIAGTIRDLPCSFSGPLGINIFQCVLIYLIAFSLFGYLQLRKTIYFKATLLFLIFLSAEIFRQELIFSLQRQLIVYSVQGISVVRLIRGRQSLQLYSCRNRDDLKRLERHVGGHALAAGLQDEQIHEWTGSWKYLTYGRRKILFSGKGRMKRIKVDILLMNNNPGTETLNALHPSKVILASGISPVDRLNLLRYFTERKIPCTTASDFGAIQLSLQEP